MIFQHSHGTSNWNSLSLRARLVYPAWSILWLLVIWKHEEPRYGQPWCWYSHPKIFFYQIRILQKRYNSIWIQTSPTFVFMAPIDDESALVKLMAWCWMENTQITKFMGPTWGPPGSCRSQMGPMLAPWTFLSGRLLVLLIERSHYQCWSRSLKPPDHTRYHNESQTVTNSYGLFEFPDSKVHGAYMGPTWGRQDPSGSLVGPMKLAIRVVLCTFPISACNWGTITKSYH